MEHSNSTVDERRQEMESLASADNAASVQRLIEGLGDSARGVRAAAFSSLEALRCPAVYTELVRCLDQKNLVVRNAASLLLINMQLRAVPALVPALANPDHDVRKFVVDILGLIPDNGADHALSALLRDPDDNVRISVVEALGNMKSRKSLAALRSLHENDESMRVTICEAMGKIGGDEAEHFLLEEAQRQLDAAEPDELLLATILDSLALCGTELAMPFLHELIISPIAEVQHAAMYALIRIHQQRYGSTEELRGFAMSLSAMLHSSNEAYAMAAASALASFPESDALMTLVSVAGHSAALDAVLVKAIGQRPRALEEILQILMSTDVSLESAQQLVLLTVFR